MARRLAVQIYWRMCKEWDHEQFHEQLKKLGSHAGKPGYSYGVKQNIEKLSERPTPLHGGV